MTSVEMSGRHQRALNAAYNEACQVNDMAHRLGSVIISGGKIVSTGHNSMRSKLGKQVVCSVHAEMAALSKLLKGTEYEWTLDRLKRQECKSPHANGTNSCLQ